MIRLNNHQQKLVLLCVLLLGCVLTSIGVEYFAQPKSADVPPPSFVQQMEPTRSKTMGEAINERRVEQANKVNTERKNVVQKDDDKQVKQKYEQRQRKKQAEVKDLVNINTATAEELDSLPGVGPAIAQKIIAHRKQDPFRSIEDIMLVKGIGKVKFAKMRERITVE